MPWPGRSLMRGSTSLTVQKVPFAPLANTGGCLSGSHRPPRWPTGKEISGDLSELVLQRHCPDCWITGPVIVALRDLGVQNGKRDGERERSDDDYAFGRHGNPPRFSSSPTMHSRYSTGVCDGHHRFSEMALREA